MFRLSREDRRVWLLIGIMTLIGALFIPFSHFILDVRFTYTVRMVAIGGSVLGVVSGVLGCFAVLRRESLMGDALSHAALPGVGVAFLVAGRELGVLLIGAGIASWLGVQFIRALLSTTRIKQDTAMGIVLVAWFAAGIALLTYIQARPDASQAGLDSFIFGQAAAMVESDVVLISLVGLAAFVMVGVFWKEFKLVTFDPEFARANGFRVNLINVMLSTLIVIAIVLGLQLAGVILMVGMLIAPGIAARQWTQKLDQMVILSAVFGAFAGGTGAVLSAVDANIPTGPMIIVAAFAIVMLSIAFAPGRGLIWSLLQRRRDRQQFAAQLAMRELYQHGGSLPENRVMGEPGLAHLARRGYVRQEGTVWMLTPQGTEAAARDAHNQRLWDVYREYSDELHLPIIIEDRQKPIREVLPGEAVNLLERKLEGTAG